MSPAAKSARDRLVCAAEELLCSRGLARLTTRSLARAAGVAEGAMYHHFSDKAELLHAVVEHGVSDFRRVLEGLPLQVGQNTVAQNLERVMESALEFHRRIVPIACSLFADRELMARSRAIMNERCVGPDKAVAGLAAYLRAEQQLGRVAAGIDPQSAAQIVLSRSFNSAMLEHFLDRRPSREATRERIRETVNTLMRGLEPRAVTPARRRRTAR